MYGGGGGGSGGYNQPWFQIYYPGDYYKGYGGSAATMTAYANIAVTPGAGIPVIVGSPGTAGVANSSTGGTAGTNSSFGSYNATGGAPGVGWVANGTNGANGNTTITGAPTAGTGGTGDMAIYNSICQHYTGTGDDPTTPGSGYGAGGAGGGFGCKEYNHGCGGYAGAGGAGAAGVVSITYPVYYNGVAPTTAYAFTKQTAQSASSLNQSSTKDYVGTILGLSVPNSGGLVSMITDTIFYQQYVSPTGLGLTYSATLSTGAPALFAGTPAVVSASNSGAASIEGRGAYGNIYDAGGVARASSLTGNTIRAADVAMSSGVFAAFGGDEGKMYMLSKQGSSTWYSYYTGAADTQILGISVAWDGSSVTSGDFGGLLKYYNTNVTVPVAPTAQYVDANVQVYKDGSPYTIQPVTIFSSYDGNTSWAPLITNNTDGSGQLHYTTTTGVYYKFVVNVVDGTTEGEGSKIWQSNTAQTIVQIYCLSPSTPFEWSATYIQDTHNVSVTYTDVEASTVNVSIRNINTGLVEYSELHTAETSWNTQYHDALGNQSYRVEVQIDRLGYHSNDARTVLSQDTFRIFTGIDDNILFALAGLVLMIIAGLFSARTQGQGSLAIVILAAVFMIWGFLPWNMAAIVTIAAFFAVMGIFAAGSRKGD
jgi:hypothetical protein